MVNISNVSCSGGAAAGGLGALAGFLGIFGMSDLVPKDSKANDDLKQAQTAFSDLQTKWAGLIKKEQDIIIQNQLSYLQEVDRVAATQEGQVINQLQFTITQNRILIVMLIFLVAFLIVFDIT